MSVALLNVLREELCYTQNEQHCIYRQNLGSIRQCQHVQMMTVLLFLFSFYPPPPSPFPFSYLFFFIIYIAYIIFLCHFYHFYEAAIAVKISNLLICFCSFDLSCPILEKYSFIENVYIVLSCPIKEHSFFFNLVCFDDCFTFQTINKTSRRVTKHYVQSQTTPQCV